MFIFYCGNLFENNTLHNRPHSHGIRHVRPKIYEAKYNKFHFEYKIWQGYELYYMVCKWHYLLVKLNWIKNIIWKLVSFYYLNTYCWKKNFPTAQPFNLLKFQSYDPVKDFLSVDTNFNQQQPPKLYFVILSDLLHYRWQRRAYKSIRPVYHINSTNI